MKTFGQALAEQRWDDHRYYHHSRINQSLHLMSALCFLCSYSLLWTHLTAAVIIGWFVAMISRQVGHFFFEPKGYDEVNGVSHQEKERIKVGYNLKRKRILLSVWLMSPLCLLVDPTLLGLWPEPASAAAIMDRIARLWLVVALAGLTFRTLQLCATRDMQTGLVWLTKILTDPFHDIYLYHRAPLHLLRGELLDPMAPKGHGRTLGVQ